MTGCPCEECRFEVRGFRGKSWPRLRLEDISGDGGNVFMLTPRAFQYLLPGLMLMVLERGDRARFLVGRIMDVVLPVVGAPASAR